MLQSDPVLQQVAVQGEISNFRHHTPSGHMYFSLKDDKARLRCVMFRGRNVRLSFQPRDGLSVIAVGSVGMYEAGGDVQLYVEDMFPEGLGRLYAQFEALKAKLAAEGLFAAERKRPLPAMPRRVGIVTSPTGAAVRDMISVLSRRFPGVEIIISPAQVQGEEAPASIIAALDRLARWGQADVVIVGRGGGSVEELWAFNDEGVARAIAAFPAPVVSAVGHETDVTIADFVADVRAPTPSAAAELVVPEKAALQRHVAVLVDRMERVLLRRVQFARERLSALQRRPSLQRPYERIAQYRQQVDDLLTRTIQGMQRAVRDRRARLEGAAGKLSALSPLDTLARGYAICRREEDGLIVRRAADVAPGDKVRVTVWAGTLYCRVDGVEEGEHGERTGTDGT